MQTETNIRYQLISRQKKLLADTFTPVGLYLKLRDRYPNSLLLESSDYHGSENSLSFICCCPIAGIKAENGLLQLSYPDGSVETNALQNKGLADSLGDFLNNFEANDLPFSGLFGYTAYDAVRYFESVELKQGERRMPDMQYHLYGLVITIDHFRSEAYITEQRYEGQEGSCSIEELEALISNRNVPAFRFSATGKEESTVTDEQFRQMVKRGKAECKRGNVFQVVLSREFSQPFKGDDFNVYRALRSVNPSPYLFYFDYSNFRIFGSSPEAQLVIKNGEASIHPIAGTFRRTGDEAKDLELANKLSEDEKERSEHVMLVDLARNDLSRNCKDVKVEVFAETQFYSHVIHLVSKVTGRVNSPGLQVEEGINVFSDTFPAGTLSGAPKHRAMQIIAECEGNNREYYGGAIGFIGFNGDINQAIVIRSFLSRDNRLYYRAGAGVVINSDEEGELQEVNNKLAALKKALQLAQEL